MNRQLLIGLGGLGGVVTLPAAASGQAPVFGQDFQAYSRNIELVTDCPQCIEPGEAGYTQANFDDAKGAMLAGGNDWGDEFGGNHYLTEGTGDAILMFRTDYGSFGAQDNGCHTETYQGGTGYTVCDPRVLGHGYSGNYKLLGMHENGHLLGYKDTSYQNSVMHPSTSSWQFSFFTSDDYYSVGFWEGC